MSNGSLVRAVNGRTVAILCLGDSNTQHESTATVAGAEKLGSLPSLGPNDLMWGAPCWYGSIAVILGQEVSHAGNIYVCIVAGTTASTGGPTGTAAFICDGTAVWAYVQAMGFRPWRADCCISDVTGALDPNAQPLTGLRSYATRIPAALRAAFPVTFNQIQIAVVGSGGSSSYSWAGVQAFANVVAGNNPAVNDTITIAGTTYTFVAAAASANQVTIAGTALLTLQNLQNAVNAEGTGYGTGTVANPNAYCPVPTAVSPTPVAARATGTPGNSFTVSASSQTGISSANAAGTAVASVSFASGSATSGLWTNASASLSAGAGFVPNIVIITLGTNDAGRAGLRGASYQTEMTSLITRLKAAYTGVKIILWRAPIVGDATRIAAIQQVIAPAATALAAADPTNVFVVDMTGLGVGAADVTVLSNDGLHLTEYGYWLWAQKAALQIGSILGLPQPAATAAPTYPTPLVRAVQTIGSASGGVSFGARASYALNTGSVSCWFMCGTNSPLTGPYIWAIETDANNRIILYNPPATLSLYGAAGGVARINASIGSAALYAGAWHHSLVSWSAAGAAVWIDGVPVFSQLTNSAMTLTAPTLSASQGLSGIATSVLRGMTSQLAIFSSALVQADATALYGGALPSTLSGYVADWPYDDAFNATTVRVRGTGTAGTLGAGATVVRPAYPPT